MLALLLLAIAVAQTPNCPSVAEQVEQATVAVVEARLEDAAIALVAAEVSLGCAGVAVPEDLAGFWLASGALAMFGGAEEDANLYFQAAARVGPEVWDPRLGLQVKEQWLAAGTWPGATGTLMVTPDPGDGLRIDGMAAVAPVVAAAGLHLVQVVRLDSVVGYTGFVRVRSAEAVSVSTGVDRSLPRALPLPITPVAPVSGGADAVETLVVPLDPPVVALERRRPPIGAVVGGLALVGAAGFAAAAWGETANMRAAQNSENLDAAWARQRAFGITGYSLLGVAAAGVVVELAW